MNALWLPVAGVVISTIILLSALGQWASGYGGLQNDVGNLNQDVEELQRDVEFLREEQAETRREINNSIQELQTELQAEIRALREDLTGNTSAYHRETLYFGSTWQSEDAAHTKY